MLQAIAGYVSVRLGRRPDAPEVTLLLPELMMTIDLARQELVPCWELWFENEYELLPQFRAGEQSCVVDVGGNVGFYALRQALRATKGRVVVFEPSPTAFRRLRYNVRANGLPNVTPVNEALGDSPGVLHFIDTASSINSRAVPAGTPNGIMVPCTTLDEAAVRFGLGWVDILKIDTEGLECAVLSGATGTLSRVRRIVLELHNDIEAEKRVVDQLLHAFGFSPTARCGAVVYYESTNTSFHNLPKHQQCGS